MLTKIRDEIDAIDNQLTELYSKRMQLAKGVAETKIANHLPVYNPAREKDIINRVTKGVAPEIKLYTKQFFNTIFETSKGYQNQFIEKDSSIRNMVNASISAGKKRFPIEATVAVSGVQGAYAGIATEKLFEISDITYFKNFDGVFTAVEKGLCEYGVLPIENSSVGSVNAVYDLMQQHNFYIVRGIKMRIQHNLIVPYGTKISDIKEIVSHEQAIGQCSKFINSLKDVKVTVVENTALAGRMVADSGRKDIACIASNETASLYGLTILQSAINDNNNNYTRFIVISKEFQIFENANKISIMVSLAHESGSLNKLLNKFSTLGLSLTKLESRPIENSMFEFLFYFDFEADICSNEVINLISELANNEDVFAFLGSYCEVN
ncbi:MAG: prephenate dehydratase domain-containing protein [Bacillota bacterium]